jgi:molybdopterin/thiamine biosynthesis adenylyltransferase
VLCIGAGGLGSPSSMYLAAAGIGTIGMIDDDVVDASNLQRQILHGTDRVGMPKVESAEATLRALNPDVQVDKHRTRITAANSLELIAPYDVVIDGADNFATRYLVNDSALRLGKPVVHASIFRFEGQITVFPGGGSPCYRCLPQPPPASAIVRRGRRARRAAGIMGVMQATEAIKLVLGLGETLYSRLPRHDA